MALLGCPECEEPTSFSLMHVEGWQEKAQYATNSNGEPQLTDASSVHVTEYSEDDLQCDNCGAIVSEDDLVEVSA